MGKIGLNLPSQLSSLYRKDPSVEKEMGINLPSQALYGKKPPMVRMAMESEQVAKTPESGLVAPKYNVFQKAVGDIATQTEEANIPELKLPSKFKDFWFEKLDQNQKWLYLTRGEGISGTEAAEQLGLPSDYAGTGVVPTAPSVRQEALYEAALQSYQTQSDVMKQRASKAAEALRMQGETTESTIQRLEELQERAYKRRETSRETWAAAAEKAEEYVQSAELRTQRALDRLDEINSGISKDRDFAKAHAMNAAVQAVIGSMSEMEDQTIQKYGVDSKEYQQFQMRKAQTLSTAHSQIEVSYQQLAEQQGLTYMNANNELQWKEDMYLSFQEQQHVETLRYLAQANDAYDMQLSQFQLTVEQMKSVGMENLANWIVATPVFSMDSLPLMTFITELLPKNLPTLTART